MEVFRPHIDARASAPMALATAIPRSIVRAVSTRETRARRAATPSRPIIAQRSPVIESRAFSARSTRSSVCASAGSTDADVVVVPGDYRIGGILLGVAALTGPVLHLWTQFLVHGALGGFLAFQASRVRFRFTRDALEVVFIEPGGSDADALAVDVASSGDNKLQGGGENRWTYDSVTNWEFWWPGFPCLVYFKETQTKSDGQPHFFPIIMDGEVLYKVMLERMPKSVNAKPSPSEWSLDLALEQTSIGRQIKENLTEDQLAKIKEIKGIPYLDKK